MGDAILFPGGSPKGSGFLSRDVLISAVPRIARICALGLAFDELLDEVCREILALTGADGGCLFLSTRDAHSETFLLAAESGTLPEVSGAYRPGPALERLLDRMRTEGRVRADDLSLLPASDPLKRLLDPFPVRSALLVPLRFGTRLLGFVALHVTDAPNPDVPALQAFTLRERYDTVVVYWLLGYGTDRIVAAIAAGLAVALLIRLRWRSKMPACGNGRRRMLLPQNGIALPGNCTTRSVSG